MWILQPGTHDVNCALQALLVVWALQAFLLRTELGPGVAPDPGRASHGRLLGSFVSS